MFAAAWTAFWIAIGSLGAFDPPRDDVGPMTAVFRTLSDEYNLAGVRLKVDASLDYPGSPVGGYYRRASKTIHLGRLDVHPRNLATLLHEVHHARQDQLGFLEFGDYSLEAKLCLERDAFAFSEREYRRRYEARYGEVVIEPDWAAYIAEFYDRMTRAAQRKAQKGAGWWGLLPTS